MWIVGKGGRELFLERVFHSQLAQFAYGAAPGGFIFLHPAGDEFLCTDIGDNDPLSRDAVLCKGESFRFLLAFLH